MAFIATLSNWFGVFLYILKHKSIFFFFFERSVVFETQIAYSFLWSESLNIFVEIMNLKEWSFISYILMDFWKMWSFIKPLQLCTSVADFFPKTASYQNASKRSQTQPNKPIGGSDPRHHLHLLVERSRRERFGWARLQMWLASYPCVWRC